LAGNNFYDVQDENGNYFLREMIEKKNGWIRYSWKKPGDDSVQMKLVNFKYYEDMDWIIAGGIYEDELYEPLNRQRFLYLIIFVCSIIIVFLLVLFLSSSFTKPIKGIVSLLEDSAHGDLTKRLPEGKNDEIGTIMKIVNEFLETLHSMTSDIKSTINLLNSSTKDLTGISQEIYTTANQQAAAVSEVVATAEEFASISKQIAMNASGVAQVAVKTEKDVEKGAGNVNTTLNKMKSIKSSNERNINEINKLMKKVEQINDVLKFINTIADQTKLIAFNAALEASNPAAGESGKRFGIVAIEIRRLAERIVESITDIEDTINEIKKATHELIISFEQSSVRIAEGFKQAEETAAVLSTIQLSSKQTSRSARQIDSGTSQQQIASDQIVSTLKEISDGIQQFVGATKHSDDITKQISELSQKFTSTISHFQLISDK
ncbi:methyl-accepting chemotaxis protein, partial [candidate division CSSED10-310 bacterium]